MASTRNAAPTHAFLAVLQVGLATLLLAGVWLALPARWWPVDLAASTVAVAWLLAGIGLFVGAEWGRRLSRGLAALTLAVSVVLVAALAWSIAALAGLYGPVGAGGALLLGAVALLLLPYLIGLPWWLWRRLRQPESAAHLGNTSGSVARRASASGSRRRRRVRRCRSQARARYACRPVCGSE